MPRVSQAVAAETRRKIVNVSFDIAMNEGFDKLTFGTIAKKAGITRSGINAHFKLKADLIDELTPMFAEIIEKPLIFSSPDAFFTSWVYAIHHEPEFVKAISHAGAIISPRSGVKGLFERIAGEPADVERCIYMSIGYAVVHLSNNDDATPEEQPIEESATA
ncbi:TetR/AcrR family transcriptional regulator [Photobacterium sp. OFAV2-7]|uniref:TetR/AcrR family transcriptional regulator n=1 Tax=Photobacterium sp. OFAV2-7 TaxID=2917748 RepID=UPI001EF4D253|nr:TetR/AcrR family transcriptional regulator [Photobacterium sp. OFAV2-7]MCG7584923.1 TetR/AcrR family transcriptional regulator [Photobacterium sp. OFAV2-7]